MVAERLAGKTEIVSDLQPSTIYLLASPSTPQTIRDELIQRKAAGEHLADHVVKSLVYEAKQKAAKANHRRAAAQAREARKSPIAIQRAEKGREESAERLRLSEAALDEIVELLIEHMGESLPRLPSAFRGSWPRKAMAASAKTRAIVVTPGALLGEAACHVGRAYQDLVATLRLDAAGLDPVEDLAAVIADVSEVAVGLQQLADYHGHAEVVRRFRAGQGA